MSLEIADWIVMALVFVFGTLVGSFLNVLVLRWGTGMAIASGRSQCFSCAKPLAWYELVPVLSFALQLGRCRACDARISWQYPAVELAGGVAFLIAYVTAFDVPSFVLLAAILCLYVAISAYDLRHKIIPNAFSYVAAGLALALVVYRLWLNGSEAWGSEWLYALIAGPALFAFYGAFWLVSKGRWMGLGDAKLALSVGWVLGLSGAIAATLLGFWSGALVAIALMAFSGFRLKSEVPFGPFIILGFILSLVFAIDFPTLLAILSRLF